MGTRCRQNFITLGGAVKEGLHFTVTPVNILQLLASCFPTSCTELLARAMATDLCILCSDHCGANLLAPVPKVSASQPPYVS